MDNGFQKTLQEARGRADRGASRQDRLRQRADSIIVPGAISRRSWWQKSLATLPDILVLDEPTAGIDIGSKTEIVELVREMARADKAVLLISSEPSELIAASDRILLMANGRIVREVAINELFSQDSKPEERMQQARQRLQVLIQEVNSND